jgi:hypothetical protein
MPYNEGFFGMFLDFLLLHLLINLCNLERYTGHVNEGPVRIQEKCLVSIYVFPEMKQTVQPPYFKKKNYNVHYKCPLQFITY